MDQREWPVREWRLPVLGASVWVVEVGEGEPIVMLHGGPGASHDYLRPQMDRLAAAGRRWVYYDQRGGGRSMLSEGVQPGTVDEHVADLERLRVHLGVERLSILGYSWGGLLGMLFALGHRDRVGRMALMSPAPSHAGARAAMLENLRLADKRREVAELKESLGIAELSLRDPVAARQARFAIAVNGYFVEPRRGLELTPFRVQQRSEQAVWKSLGEFDLRERLPSLRGIPSLVVHGREDPIPFASAVETASLIGAKLVALDRCGHVPYIEAPKPLFAALDAFFA